MRQKQPWEESSHDGREVAKRTVVTEGTMTEEVQRLKMTTRLIVTKKLIRITHAVVINHLCIFGPIVPTASVTECTRIGMTVGRLTE